MQPHWKTSVPQNPPFKKEEKWLSQLFLIEPLKLIKNRVVSRRKPHFITRNSILRKRKDQFVDEHKDQL